MSLRNYTEDEKMKILNYIIQNEAYSVLRGNVFWKKMQDDHIIDRTWQSSKEHFRKQIINNLTYFNISKTEREKIKSGYDSTQIYNVEKSNARNVKVPAKYTKLDFSDEEVETSKKRTLSFSSDDSDDLGPSTSVSKVKETKRNKSSSGSEKSLISLNSINLDNEIVRISESDGVRKSPDVIELDGNRNSPDIIESVDIRESDDEDMFPLNCSPNGYVSSTNLDEDTKEFTSEEDQQLLEFLTAHKDNLKSCDVIIACIRIYTKYITKKRTFNEYLERLIEIIDHIQLYNQSPEIVSKLVEHLDSLETYLTDKQRTSNKELRLQNTANETCSINIDNNVIKFARAEPNLKYVDNKKFEILKKLQNIKLRVNGSVEKILYTEISCEKFEKYVEHLDSQTEVCRDLLKEFYPETTGNTIVSCGSNQNPLEIVAAIDQECCVSQNLIENVSSQNTTEKISQTINENASQNSIENASQSLIEHFSQNLIETVAAKDVETQEIEMIEELNIDEIKQEDQSLEITHFKDIQEIETIEVLEHDMEIDIKQENQSFCSEETIINHSSVRLSAADASTSIQPEITFNNISQNSQSNLPPSQYLDALTEFQVEVEVKHENQSFCDEETIIDHTDAGSFASDASISIQPQMTLNLSQISESSLYPSQHLDALTSQEINVTNIVEKIIEPDTTDNSIFFSCE